MNEGLAGHGPLAPNARRARAYAPALTKRRRRRETVSNSARIISYLGLQGLTPFICLPYVNPTRTL
jgi:hypothetical protein